ncbi:MAG: S41 family peptidase [Bacilli bacterium]
MNLKLKKGQKTTGMFSIKEVICLLIITCTVNAAIYIYININIVKKGNVVDGNENNIQEIFDTYNYIKENYYKETNDKSLIKGAIKGMMESLGDNYSTYIGEDESDTYNIILQGEYEGVGIQIMENNNGTIISSIIPNSPAMKTDLKVGDLIKKINGKDATSMKMGEIGNIIKNGTQTDFEIVVSRNNEEKIIKVKRAKIILDSVSSKVIEKDNKKIGYIYIDIFASNTDKQFNKKLKELENQNINSLILDLRGNSGGHLTAVTNMISEFVDSSKVIYQTDQKGKIVKKYSTGNITKTYPIVILVNNSSASASEVMAGSLKEIYDAKLVGTKTFGKGTIQNLLPVNATGENFKLTTKKWLTPKGVWIDGIGINPDYEVILSNEYMTNPIESNDNQLQKALDLLLK